MRRVCAQCDVEIVSDDGAGPTGVSHGLCGACARRLLREALLPTDADFDPAVAAALSSLIDFWVTFVDCFHTWLERTRDPDHPISQEIGATKRRLLEALRVCGANDARCAERVLIASLAGQASALRLAVAVSGDPRLRADERAAILRDLGRHAERAADASMALCGAQARGADRTPVLAG